MAVDKNELDGLMKKVGLDAKTRREMHAANTDATPAAEAKKPRGHGAAAPHTPVIDEL